MRPRGSLRQDSRSPESNGKAPVAHISVCFGVYPSGDGRGFGSGEPSSAGVCSGFRGQGPGACTQNWGHRVPRSPGSAEAPCPARHPSPLLRLVFVLINAVLPGVSGLSLRFRRAFPGGRRPGAPVPVLAGHLRDRFADVVAHVSRLLSTWVISLFPAELSGPLCSGR